MRIAVDTNLIVYAEGVNGADRQRNAERIFDQLDEHELILPVQVLGELFAVLRRKTARPVSVLRQNVRVWARIGVCVPTTPATMERALELVVGHQLNIWDSVIFAAAAEAGCEVLLSEDMQEGFMWGGVQVINPFRADGLDLLR